MDNVIESELHTADGLVYRVKRVYDEDGDTSYMGEYTSRFAPYCVDRKTGILYGEYVGRADHTCYEVFGEDGQESVSYGELAAAQGECHACSTEEDEGEEHTGYEVLARDLSTWNGSSEYRYWQSAKQTDPEYYSLDYERMERLNRGDWFFMGLVVELLGAELGDGWEYGDDDEGIATESVWGVESDSGESHFAGERDNLIAEIRAHLQETAEELRQRAARLVETTAKLEAAA